MRETIPEELKDRMEEAMKESVVMATKGRQYVDHVKTRLDFSSKDSGVEQLQGCCGGGVPGKMADRGGGARGSVRGGGRVGG